MTGTAKPTLEICRPTSCALTDADHGPAAIDQRTAAVAGIDRGVDLEDFAPPLLGDAGDGTLRDFQASSQEIGQGVADCADLLRQFDRFGIGQRQDRQVCPRRMQDGQIMGIVARHHVATRWSGRPKSL